MDKDPNFVLILAVAVLVCVTTCTSHAAGNLSPWSLPPQSASNLSPSSTLPPQSARNLGPWPLPPQSARNLSPSSTLPPQSARNLSPWSLPPQSAGNLSPSSLSPQSAGNLSPSSLSPQSGLQPPTVCNGIDCQKGACVRTSNPLFPYKCQCQAGWRNFLNEIFLPCGIPDCQFNVSCAGTSLAPIFAPAPAPSSPTLNFSDVCSIPVCGEGDCVLANVSTSLLPSYTCHCHEGSENLFSSPSSLCVSACNVGPDCKSLGIVSPPLPSPPGTTSICSGIDCQMGNCVPADPHQLGPFQCQCDDGWKNLLNLTYLPCGLPDCDFQITCPHSSLVHSSLVQSPLSTPFGLAPAPSPLSNSTLLNICSTSVCGDGDCILTDSRILLPSYTCQCHQGAHHLFNSSSAMCAASCNLGIDCSQIPGLNSPGNSSTNAAAGREDCMISFSLLVAAAAATLNWLAK